MATEDWLPACFPVGTAVPSPWPQKADGSANQHSSLCQTHEKSLLKPKAEPTTHTALISMGNYQSKQQKDYAQSVCMYVHLHVCEQQPKKVPTQSEQATTTSGFKRLRTNMPNAFSEYSCLPVWLYFILQTICLHL